MADTGGRDVVFVLLQCKNDSVLKIFQTMLKSSFPPTHFLCSMKQAVDMAVKAKPPLIKAPVPDSLSLRGELVSTVVMNWFNVQSKKTQQVKQTAKKQQASKKAPKQADAQTETPRSSEPEILGPHFIYLYEYPTTQEQVTAMINSCAPLLCGLDIDLPGSENDKKNSQVQANQIDLKVKISGEVPFISVTFQPTGTNEEAYTQIQSELFSLYNGYCEFRNDTADIRLISIPKFPPDPLSYPLLPPEKATGKGSDKKAAQVSATAPDLSVVHDEALKNAYKIAVLSELDEFLRSANSPCVASQFQHAAELLPKLLFPYFLSELLLSNPNLKAEEIFRMRMISYREGVDYSNLYSLYVNKKFEELVGYSTGYRTHLEILPFDFLPNIIAPLSSIYSSYKWTEYAGSILLAFYHEIPEGLPLLHVKETFKLPLFESFGKWLSQKGCFTDVIDPIVPSIDKGFNVGHADKFIGFKDECTQFEHFRYFDESGIVVDSFENYHDSQGCIHASFNIKYKNYAKISFNQNQQFVKQKSEEEEEDSVEVNIDVRGSFGKCCGFLLSRNSESTDITINLPKSSIYYSSGHDFITLVGAEGEKQRIINQDGTLIRFTPLPVIYRHDGSIQYNDNQVWKYVDKDGKGYVKLDGKWHKDPSIDATGKSFHSYFMKRRVLKRTNGVSFIEEDDDLTISFPDGTSYLQNAQTFKHEVFPDVTVTGDKIIVATDLFSATFDGSGNINIETKDQEATLTYNHENGHLFFFYGQSRNLTTLVDVVTGCVANIGSKRCVYYLDDEWKWKLGHQLCSRKEFIQHFQDGDFVERLQPVEKVEQKDLKEIIVNGNKPRLFIIDKEGGIINVKELLDDAVYKDAFDSAESRINKGNEREITLWYNTVPKTYREMYNWDIITPEQQEQLIQLFEAEKVNEMNRIDVLNSVGDPKWREIQDRQAQEEMDVLDVLKQYGVQ